MTRRAVLFSGHSEYGSVNAMVEGFAVGLAAQGWTTVVVDTSAADLASRLAAALAPGVDLVVATNGIGLPKERPSFYDRLAAPVVVWMLDHPIYHPDKIAAPVPDLRLAVVSPRHVDFARAVHGPAVPVVHLAHATSADVGLPWAERDIEVLACGSPLTNDPEAFRSGWRQHGAAVEERLNRVVDAHFAAPLRPLEDLCAEALGLERLDGPAIYPYFATVDTYLRSRIKLRALSNLARRLGRGLVVCGKRWDDALPDAHRLGPVPAAETLRLMRRAKVTLNLLPPYYASHEKMFQATARGSMVASTASELWEAWFPSGSWRQIDENADLGDPTAWEGVAAAGHAAFARGGHDWAARVKTLLSALTLG